MRKKFLWSAVSILAVAGLIGLSIPFVGALKPSARAKNDSVAYIDIPNLEVGRVYEFKIRNYPLFILKPSAEQFHSIAALDRDVYEKSYGSFNKELGAFIFWGISSARFHCPLLHKPPEISRLSEYDKNAKWLGGYWDVLCEQSYDYAGRAIKTYRFSFNGFSSVTSNLPAAELHGIGNDRYAISILPR